MRRAAASARCGQCRHFVDDPAALERALVGLTILSSAYGDTRGDQGLCAEHARLLAPSMSCPRFEGRGRSVKAAPNPVS